MNKRFIEKVLIWSFLRSNSLMERPKADLEKEGD